MSTGQHVLHVLNEIEHCFNDKEMKYLEGKLKDKKFEEKKQNVFFSFDSKFFVVVFRIWIGIKSLLDIIEVARQADDQARVMRFLSQLEEMGGML